MTQAEFTRRTGTSQLTIAAYDLVVVMLDPSMQCRDMRQVSPFAGILTTAERASILRQFATDQAA